MEITDKIRELCAQSAKHGKSPIAGLLGYLRCRARYGMGMQRYLAGLEMSDAEFQTLKRDALARRQWYRRAYATNRFFKKYGSLRYDRSQRGRENRIRAYRKFYRLGAGCFVGHNVEISQRHCLSGTLTVGSYVNFAENVYIDYSGNVTIADNVMFSDGVHIITHDHDFEHNRKTYMDSGATVQGHLRIAYGAVLGTRAMIMPSCHSIGKCAKIGAGAVVTHDVPDYAVVAGVPARVIRYLDAQDAGGAQ